MSGYPWKSILYTHVSSYHFCRATQAHSIKSDTTTLLSIWKYLYRLHFEHVLVLVFIKVHHNLIWNEFCKGWQSFSYKHVEIYHRYFHEPMKFTSHSNSYIKNFIEFLCVKYKRLLNINFYAMSCFFSMNRNCVFMFKCLECTFCRHIKLHLCQWFMNVRKI